MNKYNSRIKTITEKIETIVMETIKNENLIENNDKIVIGVSGGPDSMCLINNLKVIRNLNIQNAPNEPGMNGAVDPFYNSRCSRHDPNKPGMNGVLGMAINFEIVVAHVNHMLRKEANEEEIYVKDYCEKNGIEFYSKSIDIEKMANTNKIGTEEAGRIARYEFFNEVLNMTKSNKIAIAHNKNDKAETILLHTLRGSGIEGLKGIEAKRGNIIRPIINCERADIEKYCEEQNLNPRIDESNFENIYNRNKIRNIVIPYIQKEFNPNIVKTLDRLAEIVTLEDEYMEKQMKNVYKDLILEDNEKEIVLDLKKFILQERVIKSRLIRYIIKRLFGSAESIGKIHIDDIIKLCDNNVGNKYLTPNKNLKVLVKNRKVYFILGNFS